MSPKTTTVISATWWCWDWDALISIHNKLKTWKEGAFATLPTKKICFGGSGEDLPMHSRSERDEVVCHATSVVDKGAFTPEEAHLFKVCRLFDAKIEEILNFMEGLVE